MMESGERARVRTDNDGHDSTRLQQAIMGRLGGGGEGINAYFVEGGEGREDEEGREIS